MKTVQEQASHPAAHNPGEELRQAREAKGLGIAEVATQLNLTKQRLSQIEEGAFDKLPGATFARGYVRAYAKFLGLDQDRLALEFDHFTGAECGGAQVHSLGRIESPVRYSQSILRFVSFVLLLALIVGGFWWWQQQAELKAAKAGALLIEQVEVEGADGTTQIHLLAEPEDQAVIDAQGEEVAVPLMSGEESGQETAVVAEEGVEASAAPVESAVEAMPTAPATPAIEPVAAVQPVAAEPAPEAAVAVTAVASENTPAAGQSVLQIKFIADCWTQVKDADGKILLSALKRAGDQVELNAKAPLELRLGFARGAQVTFNGQPVDVAPFTSGETARLQLGQ